MMEDYLDKFIQDTKSSKNLLPLAARIKDVPHTLGSLSHVKTGSLSTSRRISSFRRTFPFNHHIVPFAQTPAMSSVRPMTPADLLKFNPCNLDHLTETYNIGFYLDYFSKWPELCMVIEAPHGEIEGYSELLSSVPSLVSISSV